MTNEDKLNICKSCSYYSLDGSDEYFEGTKNDYYCDRLNSLIRAHLLNSCPEEKW